MGTYYVHKATRSRKIPYSFQCEHCMKDSGPLTAEITVTVEENSNYQTLEEGKRQKLDKAAEKKLGDAIAEAYRNAEEKQVFHQGFRDECPHCSKPQSWSIAGAKGNAASTVLAILFVGVVVCAGVYFSQGQDLRLTLLSAAVFAVVAAGYSVVKAFSILAKKRKTASASQKNLPVIDWAPVKEFL